MILFGVWRKQKKLVNLNLILLFTKLEIFQRKHFLAEFCHFPLCWKIVENQEYFSLNWEILRTTHPKVKCNQDMKFIFQLPTFFLCVCIIFRLGNSFYEGENFPYPQYSEITSPEASERQSLLLCLGNYSKSPRVICLLMKHSHDSQNVDVKRFEEFKIWCKFFGLKMFSELRIFVFYMMKKFNLKNFSLLLCISNIPPSLNSQGINF